MFRTLYHLAVLALATCTLGVTAHAQVGDDARRIRATRITVAPALDGNLDDAAWADAAPSSGFVQRAPVAGAPATVSTEVRIAYDDEKLYVAVRLDDPAPDSMSAPLARRDVAIEHSEWLYVMLDSYNDRRSAFVFMLNPRGVQRDFAVAGDASEDHSWDAVWAGVARTSASGWSAEIAIPLSQLRFDPSAPAWGLNVGRYLARRQELSFWAPWPPDASGYVSRFGVLEGLEELPATRRIELRPYAVARVRRSPYLAGDPFRRASELVTAVGADVRVGLGSSFTLSAAINPDFGQVEADPAEVNLTAFETPLEERRPFFVEGTEIFNFGLGASDNLFYSRRIGRAPQGAPPASARYREQPEATNVLGALKVAGRTSSGLSAGVLSAVTGRESARFALADGSRGETAVEPRTGYSVARVIQSFRGGRTAVGGIATSTERALDDDGLRFLPHSARVAGADARHRFGASDQFELQGRLVGSRIAGTPEAMRRLQLRSGRYFQRTDASHLEVDSTRTSLGGAAASVGMAKIGGTWRWGVDGAWRSPGLETGDLGFLQSVDLLSQSSYVQYRRSRPAGPFRSWDARLSQAAEWTTAGERTGTSLSFGSNFQLHNYWGGYLQPLRRNAALSTSALRGGPALLVPGYTRLVGIFYTDRRQPLSGRLIVNGMREDGTGGWSQQISPTLDVRLASNADLSIGLPVDVRQNPAQYVATGTASSGTRYLFGRLRQTEVSLRTRLNYAVLPTLSLQLHAEPFISAGRYDRFAEVAAARARSFAQRFRAIPDAALTLDDASGRYEVDLNADGEHDVTFSRPDFNWRELRASAVARWEYRPGSTLFVVWQQLRRSRAADGTFDLDQEVSRLLATRPTNVLLVKVTHWLGY